MKTRTIQLGEVVAIVGGGTPRRDRSDYYGGTIPWMTVKDFGEGFTIRTTQERITRAGLENSATRLIPAGNVIIGTRMSVGRATLNDVDLAINQDLKALLCQAELLPQYLTFFLSFAAPKLEAKATGATVKGITIDDIQELELPLPSLPDQRRIAGMLEQADRLRRTRRYALELSDTFLPAAFLEMFGDRGAHWPKATLGEVTEQFSYGTSVKCGGQANETPVLRIPNIIGDTIDIHDLKYGALANSERKKLLLLPGDLLFVRTNGNPDYVGKCAVFDLQGDYCFASYLIRSRLHQTTVSPVFVAGYLRSMSGRKCMRPAIRTTAGQFNVSVEGLRDVAIPVPPLRLQQRFADLVREHERLRAAQRECLRQAEYLFQSLLYRAFGEGLQ